MDFVTEITTFPMVIFTVMFGVMLGLWTMTFVGVIDFDGADGALDGAADGVLDGAADAAAHGVLDGAADAAAHGVLDGALDGAAHGVLDGAADAAAHGVLDGAAEGVAEGAGEALDGAAHAADGAHAADSAMGWVQALGLRKVPITIAFSFVTIFSSVLVYWGQHLLVPAEGLMHWIAGAGVAAGGLFGGTLLASLAIKPLAKAVTPVPAARRKDLLGLECTISTGEVDQGFGQATIRHDGAELHIQVRCEPERLARGGKALIVDWDPAEGAYLVEPMEPLLLGEASRKGD